MLRLRPCLRLIRSLAILPTSPALPSLSFHPSPPLPALQSRQLHSSLILLKKKGKGREKKANTTDLSPEMEEYLQLDLLRENNEQVVEHFRDQVRVLPLVFKLFPLKSLFLYTSLKFCSYLTFSPSSSFQCAFQILHGLTLNCTAETIARTTVRTDDGHMTQIGHIAKVVQKSPQLIIVDLSGSLSAKNVVMNMLHDLGAGITNEESGTLYVSVPIVTQETRQELAKRGKALMNKAKKEMDQLHSKWAHKLRPKDVQKHKFSNNDVFEGKQMLVTIVHEYHHKVEELWKRREKEILH